MLRFLSGTLCGVALTAALVLPLTSGAAPSTKEAKARQMMAMTGAGDMGQQVMSQMMSQFQSMGVPKEFSDRFIGKAKADELVEMVVPIYVELLDESTMDAAIAFFGSEEGKKLVAAQPEITQRSMEVGQAWGQKLGLEVAAELAAGR